MRGSSTASAAEAPGRGAAGQSLAPPVVAPLSQETEEPRERRARWARSGVAASPGGQLAATVSVIVFAFLIAGLASKRGREE